MQEKIIKQVKSEIDFLTGKNMKWLVHEADIGSCHENYLPILHRVNKLKTKLKSLSHSKKSILEEIYKMGKDKSILGEIYKMNIDTLRKYCINLLSENAKYFRENLEKDCTKNEAFRFIAEKMLYVEFLQWLDK